MFFEPTCTLANKSLNEYGESPSNEFRWEIHIQWIDFFQCSPSTTNLQCAPCCRSLSRLSIVDWVFYSESVPTRLSRKLLHFQWNSSKETWKFSNTVFLMFLHCPQALCHVHVVQGVPGRQRVLSVAQPGLEPPTLLLCLPRLLAWSQYL